MRRTAVAAMLIALLGAVVVAGATAAPSSPGAQAAKKCKGKKKHRKHPHGKRRGRCKQRDSGGGGPAPEKPGALPARLLVTESEYTLQLSKATLPAGSAIVEQYNHGEDSHDLKVLKTADSTLYSFDELAPGLTARKTLTLTPGTWQLFCSLSNHQSLGMNAYLTVN